MFIQNLGSEITTIVLVTENTLAIEICYLILVGNFPLLLQIRRSVSTKCLYFIEVEQENVIKFSVMFFLGMTPGKVG